MDVYPILLLNDHSCRGRNASTDAETKEEIYHWENKKSKIDISKIST